MASGDIVYQRNNVTVMDTYTQGKASSASPEPILNWKINFRTAEQTADYDKLNLNLTINSDEVDIGIGPNPFDVTKHYDLIIKEH